MFIDEAQIYIKAGKGGDGAVSFRREKFIPKGGPDGGDGGSGGDIIIKTDNQGHGLALFNREKNFKAENGQNGMGQKKTGKGGQDLILKAPAGTQIYDTKGKLLFDLVNEGEEIILAKGGNGGWGNQHFASSIKQAPKWSKQGLKGESMKINLILKSIADVGLIGLPNAGKSTLLSVLSNAHPKIADYPFTTLEPNLGIIKNIERNIILADIPGLIAGASQGLGLGDKFLRHVERTTILVHLIDANSDDVVRDYKIIRKELKAFSTALEQKKEIVVLNKIDSMPEKDLKDKIKALKKIIPTLRSGLRHKIVGEVTPFLISAATHKNIEKLIEKIEKNI